MKHRKRITAIVLSIMLILSMMPAMAFAEDETQAPDASEVITEDVSVEEEVLVDEEPEASPEEAVEEVEDTAVPVEEAVEEEYDADESGTGYEEISIDQEIDPEAIQDTDSEELFEDFLLSNVPVEDEDLIPNTPLSVKGDRLTGNGLKFYKYFKSIISKVTAAKTSSSYMKTYKKVKLSTILGKRKFTAKELGVSRIGYKKNGKWYVSDAAQKKITALISDPKWSTVWPRIFTSLVSDKSSASYWVDWWSESNPNNVHYQFIKWNCPYTYNGTSLTFTKSASITFRLPVNKEFRYSGEAFKASTSKIKGAATAKNNAKTLVKNFNNAVSSFYENGYTPEQVDCIRMLYYCEAIANLNTYDHEAAEYNASHKGGPWSMIPVFDNNSSTNVVCTGYARAFKYLCDLSKFNSNWIDCQIVSGDAGGGHMWNIVRMHDGKNYLIDPTWMDNDTTGDIDWEWFLRGMVWGDDKSFTIACSYPDSSGNYYTNYSSREYEDWVIKTFAAGERRLSTTSYYEFLNWSPYVMPISLAKPTIKTPGRGKASFKAKWGKASPINALYVDGYQIQYSTKKNMKGAKKVTVKGYGKTSKTVKNLKSKKVYYIRVRTYAKLGGKTYYSPWSSKKKVRTK